MKKIDSFCDHRLGEFVRTIYSANDICRYPHILFEEMFIFYKICPLCKFKIDKEFYLNQAKVFMKD